VDEDLYPLYYREEGNWWWSAGRRALVTSLWRRYGSPRTRPRLLEVGCGTGGLLRELSSWAEAYGLDLEREAVAFCQERGIDRACQGSVNTLPFRDNTFDGIIGVDVLEHLDDDEGALRELLRVCRPGGVLVATVPAFQFLWSRRDVQLHHKRRYTLPQFRARVARAGFQVLKSTYVNLPLFLPLLVMVKTGRLRSGANQKVDYALVPGAINRVLGGVFQLEGRLLAHVSLPIGSSIVCVGAKPAPAGEPQRPVKKR
jgi:SAM-dependent methyltransferase